MTKKRCIWGTCNSDSRYKHKEHMKGVDFVPFAKPKRSLGKCLRWIRLCGRPHSELNVDKIDKYKYVCTKHFVDGWPTEENPDPLAADPAVNNSRRRRGPGTFKAKKAKFSNVDAANVLLSLKKRKTLNHNSETLSDAREGTPELYEQRKSSSSRVTRSSSGRTSDSKVSGQTSVACL